MLVLERLAKSDLNGTLEELQAQVRKDPAEVKHRIFLFQLLAVLGDWQRAITQLNVIGEMDALSLPMVQTYRQALQCEALRSDVFAGERSPLVFGKPEQWMALLFEALRITAEGDHQHSQEVRSEAFELAPMTSGRVGEESGERFEWIADADSRLGPMLEAIIDGKYYWVPFQRIRKVAFEEPADLRDVVWTPAFFTWANGGESAGLIPTRYPGTELTGDSTMMLAHKTEWDDSGAGLYRGLGQRILATDRGEYPLMDVRNLTLDADQGTEPKDDSAEGAQ